ncbi:hypothetical protein [Pseudonocardia sp. MH-G8]|uniref:hypothetical protein n=1 Tax=Pseudonocardia sp. MH-G8 TaxID=1854588 RepID=UPI000BA0E841|nr:hypothetical protein [Pseudonocardia sp. MH-G8]OZM81145.1 hypothetical protein CFP66_17345 [Pseudonocardia sp. MH-G8]
MGLFSSPKSAATKSARNAAKGSDRDGEDTKFVVKFRARVPLVDAGQTYSVRVTGKATKNAIRRELTSDGYEVVQVRRSWWQ